MDDMDRQMREDFAKLPGTPGGGPMERARKLVEWHVAHHGPIPKAQSLIDEIASEMALCGLLRVKPR